MTSTPSNNKRRGFTIAELLAVVAVVALVAGIGVPMAAGWLRLQRMTEAIDGLRTDWIKARTLAMDEGRPYRFQVLPSLTSYRLAPNEAEFWPEHTTGVNAPPSGSDEESGAWVYEQNLPEGLRFEPSGDAVDIVGGGESTWLFLPDGRARLLDPDGHEHEHSSIIVVETEGIRRRQLMMRALTGQARLITQGQ
jgi:prepilin-type N-terminal cleavage/methylation domain-containing protein